MRRVVFWENSGPVSSTYLWSLLFILLRLYFCITNKYCLWLIYVFVRMQMLGVLNKSWEVLVWKYSTVTAVVGGFSAIHFLFGYSNASKMEGWWTLSELFLVYFRCVQDSGLRFKMKHVYNDVQSAKLCIRHLLMDGFSGWWQSKQVNQGCQAVSLGINQPSRMQTLVALYLDHKVFLEWQCQITIQALVIRGRF